MAIAPSLRSTRIHDFLSTSRRQYFINQFQVRSSGERILEYTAHTTAGGQVDLTNVTIYHINNKQSFQRGKNKILTSMPVMATQWWASRSCGHRVHVALVTPYWRNIKVKKVNSLSKYSAFYNTLLYLLCPRNNSSGDRSSRQGLLCPSCFLIVFELVLVYVCPTLQDNRNYVPMFDGGYMKQTSYG